MKYGRLSLTAGLGIALNCVERYCEAKKLRNLEVDGFLDYMWAFPCITCVGEGFGAWEASQPLLVDVALGDAKLPRPFVQLLESSGVSPAEFGKLIESVAIVFDSFYTKAIVS